MTTLSSTFQYTKLVLDNLFANRKGVTAIEYGLIAGAIGIAIIGAVTLVGGDLVTLFTTVGTRLNAVPAGN